MSLKVKAERPDLFGSLRAVIGTIEFDDDYDGDEVLTPSMIGLSEIKFVSIPPSGGYYFEWDRSDNTVKVYDDSGEVSEATDLSSLTDVLFLALGR